MMEEQTRYYTKDEIQNVRICWYIELNDEVTHTLHGTLSSLKMVATQSIERFHCFLFTKATHDTFCWAYWIQPTLSHDNYGKILSFNLKLWILYFPFSILWIHCTCSTHHIHYDIIQFSYLLTCKVNTPEASYKVNTNVNKTFINEIQIKAIHVSSSSSSSSSTK
jgi:hypothetical protein